MRKSRIETESDAVMVEISAIDVRFRPASQMRVTLNPEAIEEYALHLDEMPPVKLMFDEGSDTYWVIDGAHTISATWCAKRKEVLAVVQEGSFLDAWKQAASANDTHGVRVTNADKRHRVEEALQLPAMQQWSSSKIAEWCGVSDKTVEKLRPESTSENPKLSRIGRDGKTRKPKRRRERVLDPEDNKAETQEASKEPSSNGHANPESTTQPASTSSRQTKEEATDEDADRWEEHIQKALNILSSLERRGGVKALIRNWRREKREHFSGRFRYLVSQFNLIISQIEETL